ncbi:hypothetical protein [Oleidesulfovibrio sp.]|uniref:hypothetical protein n=1 Tax=Oleidesulfovibrio sp. TaxID=2909707 RepID=UPI003A86085B
MQKYGSWILGMVLSLISGLVLALTLVWLNIERVDMAYGLKKLQVELNTKENHASKLEAERDNLLSPYRLRELAEGLGMGPAKPGQIRRMEEQ